jgi:ATP-dependent Lon protease
MSIEEMLINSVKLISLNNINKLFNTLSNDTLKNPKEINYLLDILEQDYIRLIKQNKNKSNITFNEIENEEDYNYYVYGIHLKVINSIRDALKKSKYRNITNFVRNEIRSITNKCNSINKITINKPKKSTNRSKRAKKDDLEDYVDDSDEDVSDDEYSDDELNDDSPYEPYNGNGGGGGSSDDLDNTNPKKRKMPPMKTPNMSITGTNYIYQLYRGKEEKLEGETVRYYKDLPEKQQTELYNKLKTVNEYHDTNEPILFKIANLDLPVDQRNHIMKNYITANTSRGEQKLKQWIDNVLQIPFGIYKGTNISSLKPKKVKNFINNLQVEMDNAVWGHDEAKRLIIQIMGQQIRNPKSRASVLAIHGPPGNGKCFKLDTPILMYDGTTKKVQDVSIDDKVMGDDSMPRRVLSLGRGTDYMYEINEYNGSTYTVNSEHILCLKVVGLNCVKMYNNLFRVEYFNKKTYKMLYETYNNIFDATDKLYYLLDAEVGDSVIEITVNDYLNLPTNIKKGLRGYRTDVIFKSKPVLCDPYIIGYWLGDDKVRDTLLETNNKNINNYIDNFFKVNQFNDTIMYYNLSETKYIPSEYKINDRNIRLKLLAGLIDSTGYYNYSKKLYYVSTVYDRLNDDIVYLCRSLGFRVRSNYNDQYKKYNIQISGKYLKDIPILCNRKRYISTNSFEPENNLYKIDVRYVEYGNYYGFTLDGNNRFLLGDFTVTHNTSVIKEGIAKAMNKPFVFISLGGATDSSFLDGHSYTYEGSIYGRIMNGLITAKCMDPIIYFDELDKISKTHKGDEITNMLVHLTDPAQNSHFRDKYFHGIDIDLSRATMIFSFNDISNVNPILLDRITTVETKHLLPNQKIHIAKNYLCPVIFKDMGLLENSIVFSDEIIGYMIEKYTCEGGVRKLKSLLYNIIREFNIANLTNDRINDETIHFPLNVKLEHIKHFLKDKREITPEKIHQTSSVGVINGLYASSSGSYGGIIPIEILWTPSNSPFDIKATGNLEKVIKESTQVALTLAYSKLDEDAKEHISKESKTRSQGFHVHMADGATSKDGPSAGTALTVALYSLLVGRKIRNDIAITGEITLKGNVTAIGGLDNKLEGAKKAGVKLVLYPLENDKDVQKIKIRNPNLIDDNFKVIAIETINEALKYSLL